MTLWQHSTTAAEPRYCTIIPTPHSLWQSCSEGGGVAQCCLWHLPPDSLSMKSGTQLFKRGHRESVSYCHSGAPQPQPNSWINMKCVCVFPGFCLGCLTWTSPSLLTGCSNTGECSCKRQQLQQCWKLQYLLLQDLASVGKKKHNMRGKGWLLKLCSLCYIS